VVDGISYDQFLALFGPGVEPPADWPAAWDEALVTFPGERLAFLTEEFLRDTGPRCGICEEVSAELRRAAARVGADPRLARIAWFLHRIYLRTPMPQVPEIGRWPFNSRPLPAPASMIPALVVIAGVPALQARHRARGISDEITRATLGDLEMWIRHFRRAHGYWGLQNLAWLSYHLRGKLVRLGRLQFKAIDFAGPLWAFAHRMTGRVTALCAPGIVLRRDGFVNGTNGVTDDQAWTSTLERNEQAAIGYPVDPRGFVRREQVTLPASQWRPALAPGDPVLDIHIPEGGPMDFDACGESMREALAFFPRHCPESPPAVAFFCSTWFFDAHYQRILPAISNIVRVQREFSLFPVLSDDREPFGRVFGQVPRDLASAPRDSSLQRAILDFTMAGGQLRCAGGFCLVDGWRWGSQRYQTGNPPDAQNRGDAGRAASGTPANRLRPGNR